MVKVETKRLYFSAGSYHLVLPISFVREHRLEKNAQVEVISNGELLVRPIRGGAHGTNE